VVIEVDFTEMHAKFRAYMVTSASKTTHNSSSLACDSEPEGVKAPLSLKWCYNGGSCSLAIKQGSDGSVFEASAVFQGLVVLHPVGPPCLVHALVWHTVLESRARLTQFQYRALQVSLCSSPGASGQSTSRVTLAQISFTCFLW
jgi:hypothetical protein